VRQATQGRPVAGHQCAGDPMSGRSYV